MINGSNFTGQRKYNVLETGINVVTVNVIIRCTIRVVHKNAMSFRLASKAVEKKSHGQHEGLW